MKLMPLLSIASVLVSMTFPLNALAALQPVVPFAGTSDLSLITAIQVIINVFLALVGIVAALFIIIGGVQFISASGDEKGAEKAKHTIMYSVIGLIVIGLSAAIVNFVLFAILAS